MAGAASATSMSPAIKMLDAEAASRLRPPFELALSSHYNQATMVTVLCDPQRVLEAVFQHHPVTDGSRSLVRA